MEADEYLKESANIKIRLNILIDQINNHVECHGNSNLDMVRPLIDRQQVIIDELLDLDRKYLGV